MATHKSAAKRARQAVKRNTRNSTIESTVRTFEKKLRKVVASKDGKAAQALLKEFTSVIGKAAQKGAVHVKSASRKIGRISKQVQAFTKSV